MNVTARATRSGKWWAIEVPEIPGLFTQARRLDQIPELVRDAAAMLGHAQVDVTVDPQLAPADMALFQQARNERRELKRLEQSASAKSRALAAHLAASGLTVRDIGVILDVSHQRAAQLVNA